MFTHIRLVLIVLFLIFLSSPLSAGSQQSITSSLRTQNLSPLRVYFDVNIGIAKQLDTRLMLINKTYDQLVQQGHRPQFVVGFRGKASYFVTKGDGYVEPEDLDFKKKILLWVKTLEQKGIRLEQCRIAAGLTGIKLNDFLPEVEVIDNGYVAMIIYQNQGYSQIPMD